MIALKISYDCFYILTSSPIEGLEFTQNVGFPISYVVKSKNNVYNMFGCEICIVI